MPAYLEQGLLEGQPVRAARPRRRRQARGVGQGPRSRGAARPQARHLWRARWRPVVGALLSRGRSRLRVVLAVPRAARPPRRGARRPRRHGSGHVGVTVATVRLPDGRAVAYEEYGDPGGFPVLNCHGGLLCRLDVEPAAAVAAELGLRIVSPDRPGVGRSDRHPDASTADWAVDAEYLLDELGIDRCAVMGWSAGGQYALGVAARLGARVTHTAVIAGCVPLDDTARRKELSKLDRRFVWLSTRTPWLARGVFARSGGRRRAIPSRTTQRSVATGSPTPNATRCSRPATGWAGRWPRRCTTRAVRSTTTAAFVAPWGFAPEDVTARSRSGRATATGSCRRDGRRCSRPGCPTPGS